MNITARCLRQTFFQYNHQENWNKEASSASEFLYQSGLIGGHPDYSEEKWIEIIQKTWNKMSGGAHEFALSGKIRLPESLTSLIHEAVASTQLDKANP